MIATQNIYSFKDFTNEVKGVYSLLHLRRPRLPFELGQYSLGESFSLENNAINILAKNKHSSILYFPPTIPNSIIKLARICYQSAKNNELNPDDRYAYLTLKFNYFKKMELTGSDARWKADGIQGVERSLKRSPDYHYIWSNIHGPIFNKMGVSVESNNNFSIGQINEKIHFLSNNFNSFCSKPNRLYLMNAYQIYRSSLCVENSFGIFFKLTFTHIPMEYFR